MRQQGCHFSKPPRNTEAPVRKNAIPLKLAKGVNFYACSLYGDRIEEILVNV